jgi:hypothetical protein
VGTWYEIGVAVGTGVAFGVGFVALLLALRLGPVVSLVLACAAAVVIGLLISDWAGAAGGVAGAALGVVGAALLARGTVGRGGTAGGTGFLLLLAALMIAGLAWVPAAGYVAAVLVPVLGLRARRRSPERYAGLRTLAK